MTKKIKIPQLAIAGDGRALDDRRVERMRVTLQALADAARIVWPGLDVGVGQSPAQADFEAILANRIRIPSPVPSWIVVEPLCVTVRCSDCGQPDERGDYGTVHYSSIEEARSSVTPPEWDADPVYTFVGEDLVCSSCREKRECKASGDHQWREISRPPTMHGSPPKLWVCDNCGETSRTDPAGPR